MPADEDASFTRDYELLTSTPQGITLRDFLLKHRADITLDNVDEKIAELDAESSKRQTASFGNRASVFGFEEPEMPEVAR
jgi:primosomal replication protein N